MSLPAHRRLLSKRILYPPNPTLRLATPRSTTLPPLARSLGRTRLLLAKPTIKQNCAALSMCAIILSLALLGTMDEILVLRIVRLKTPVSFLLLNWAVTQHAAFPLHAPPDVVGTFVQKLLLQEVSVPVFLKRTRLYKRLYVVASLLVNPVPPPRLGVRVLTLLIYIFVTLWSGFGQLFRHIPLDRLITLSTNAATRTLLPPIKPLSVLPTLLPITQSIGVIITPHPEKLVLIGTTLILTPPPQKHRQHRRTRLIHPKLLDGLSAHLSV